MPDRTEPRFRLGLVVNPVAGLGGRVGLKGTDGMASLALERGAVPEAMAKAARALALLSANPAEIFTGGGDLGETACRLVGLVPTLVAAAARTQDGGDTVRVVEQLRAARVDLILFAGGDGTARLVARHAGGAPILGIPAGVKMYSSVFARSPAAAGLAVLEHIAEATGRRRYRDVEILDIDEAALANGIARPRLLSVARAPATVRLQGAKASPPSTADADLAALATVLAQTCRTEQLVIFGPGTGTAAILSAMGLQGTLVGVDATRHGEMAARDASEADLLALMAGGAQPHVVVGVLGGLGALFGRGNQQIGPQVLRRAGRARITVIASAAKLAGLAHLFLDTGDESLDAELAGHWRIRTAPRRDSVMRVVAGGA